MPVIAVRWSGVGEGSGEEAVPLELKKALFDAFWVLFLPLQLPVLQAKTDDLGPWAWKTSHTLCTCNISNREFST